MRVCSRTCQQPGLRQGHRGQLGLPGEREKYFLFEDKYYNIFSLRAATTLVQQIIILMDQLTMEFFKRVLTIGFTIFRTSFYRSMMITGVMLT